MDESTLAELIYTNLVGMHFHPRNHKLYSDLRTLQCDLDQLCLVATMAARNYKRNNGDSSVSECSPAAPWPASSAASPAT